MDHKKLMAVMKVQFVSQGKEGILKARAIEGRLMRKTWEKEGYDLLPKLRTDQIPTLVIYRNHDFIPGDIATHIAQAIPDSQMITLRGCRPHHVSRMSR